MVSPIASALATTLGDSQVRDGGGDGAGSTGTPHRKRGSTSSTSSGGGILRTSSHAASVASSQGEPHTPARLARSLSRTSIGSASRVSFRASGDGGSARGTPVRGLARGPHTQSTGSLLSTPSAASGLSASQSMHRKRVRRLSSSRPPPGLLGGDSGADFTGAAGTSGVHASPGKSHQYGRGSVVGSASFKTSTQIKGDVTRPTRHRRAMGGAKAVRRRRVPRAAGMSMCECARTLT